MIIDEKYELPTFLEKASLELKGLWVQREKLKEKADNHPFRLYTIQNEKGDELVLDCKMGTGFLKKRIIDFCGTGSLSESYIKEAHRRRNYFQSNYFVKVGTLSRRINNLLAQRGANSVLDLKEVDILELLGKFYTIEEVCDIINNKWHYNMPIVNLKKWIKHHEVIIEKKKADYVLKNKDFRIATETGRLEVLNQQLAYYQDKFNERHSNETTRIIISLLEQARKEVKGNELSLTIDGKIDINATLQGAKNIMEISKELPINMIVIGLVASKRGINPLSIMTALSDSYYSNQNGFNSIVTGSEKDTSPINLIKNYNWDELERKHRELQKKSREVVENIEEAEVIEEGDSIREKLLKSLKEFRNSDKDDK